MKTAFRVVLIVSILLSARLGTAADRAVIEKLLVKMNKTTEQIDKLAEDIRQLTGIIVETRGKRTSVLGLHFIVDSLYYFSDQLNCEWKALFLYGLIKEKESQKYAAKILLDFLKANESERSIKQFWLGYNQLKKNNEIHLADKAHSQIAAAQKLLAQLIQFYDFEYQNAN